MERLDWSETYPNDVDHRFALVVAMPGGIPRDFAPTFGDILRSITEESLGQGTIPEMHKQLAVRPYQIGPSAEWVPTFLVTVQHLGPSVLEIGANLATIATAVIAVAKRIRRWTENPANFPDSSIPIRSLRLNEPVVSEPVVLGMCLTHIQDTYGEFAKATIQWHSRSTNEYGTASHPAGYEIYTVRVRLDNRVYVYVVDGYCRVIDHFLIEEKSVIPLILPNWLDETHFPQAEIFSADEICLE